MKCFESTCNSHVVLLQLHRQPAVPLKRKRRYCELPVLDVLSSGLVDGSDQYLYSVLLCFSISVSLRPAKREDCIPSPDSGEFMWLEVASSQ